MVIYDDVLKASAGLLNDKDRTEYTNAVQFPYLNIALLELQEMYALNNIPVTQETSAIIHVPAGNAAVTFAPDPPGVIDYLPADLVEIKQLFSSSSGRNDWIRVSKVDYLTSQELPNNSETSYINVWAWMNQEVRFLRANQDNDIKIDYIKTLFPVVDEVSVGLFLSIINAFTFLSYRTGALCAEFVMENPSRASSLNGNASLSIDRALGIGVKGKQSMVYRRRPFRAAFKRKGILI